MASNVSDPSSEHWVPARTVSRCVRAVMVGKFPFKCVFRWFFKVPHVLFAQRNEVKVWVRLQHSTSTFEMVLFIVWCTFFMFNSMKNKGLFSCDIFPQVHRFDVVDLYNSKTIVQCRHFGLFKTVLLVVSFRGKLGRYPPWPGKVKQWCLPSAPAGSNSCFNLMLTLGSFCFSLFQIVSPPKDLKKPRGKKCHFVKFFGTEDQWVTWARTLMMSCQHFCISTTQYL